MSKTLTFRGTLDMGVQQKIKLATLKGKTGYIIKKLQVISTTPGVSPGVEYVTKIYSTKQTSFPATVDFSEGELLAVNYYQDHHDHAYPDAQTIIFDSSVFNQDIFIYCEDASSGTIRSNYFLQLETMALSDIQSTQLTLKNLRTIASR